MPVLFPWLRRPVIPIEMLVEHRSGHPLDILSREFDTACTNAIDRYQIAASLEAGGLTDQIARDQYSEPDVFSVAAKLHSRVPARIGVQNANPKNEEVQENLALVLRGPLYLVPVLYFSGLGDVARRPGFLWIAIAGLLFAWVWNQALGVFIHGLIGQGDSATAARMGRWSLVVGTVTVMLIAWPIAHLVFANGSLAILAGVQTAYLIASSSLLILSRDRLLMAALTPGILLLLGLPLLGVTGERLVLGLGVATVVAVVAALMWIASESDGEPFRVPDRVGLRIAGIHALLGGTWAAMIILAGFAVAPALSPLTAVSIAASPIVLTMGLAELQLRRLRSGARRLLARTDEPNDFAGLARRAFVQASLVYFASILAVAVVIGVASRQLDGADEILIRLSIAFVFLGCAMFSGQALVAMGRPDFALGAAAFALGATALLIGQTGTGTWTPAAAYGAGCLALCATLTIVALDTTVRPVVYR